jgi:GAF domain-containing protein
MASLDIFSVRALMQALEKIHSTLDLEVLPEALFSALEDLVPDAGCSLDQLDLGTGIVTEITNAKLVLPEQIKKRILELMASHPAMPTYKAGRRGVIPVTDCISQRQFQKTPHYQEILRPVGLEYQVVITLEIPGKIAGMTVNRATDFTDKELTLLRLLAPQITLAHRNAQAFAALNKALPTDGYLVADGMGRIRFCTSKADKWLEEYFDHRQSSVLPNQLVDWLNVCSFQLFSPDNLSDPLT